MTRLPRWQRIIGGAGALKVAGAFVLIPVAALMPEVGVTPHRWLMFAHVVVFTVSAAALLLGGRRDRRAALLGIAFLLEASAFADRMLDPFLGRPGVIGGLIDALVLLRPDAFAPFFFWGFVREFPRTLRTGWERTVGGACSAAALLVGALLFAANLLRFAAGKGPTGVAPSVWLDWLSADLPIGSYWTMVYALTFGAMAMLALRARRATGSERRRVRLLGGGLALATAPAILWSLTLEIVPSTEKFLTIGRVGWLIYPFLLGAPIWVAYVVLVHKALDVRIVLRRAVQYTLERQVVAAAAMLPFALLVVHVWRSREERVSALFSNADGVLLAVFAALGIMAVRGRRVMIDRLDHRFFREEYDARRILSQLAESCRRATSTAHLAEVLRGEIDRALHPESVHLLTMDDRTGMWTSSSGGLAPLAPTTRLTELASARGTPVDMKLESSHSTAGRLPPDDQGWLVDHGVRLLVPLISEGSRLIGLLVLGEKKSELAYTREDCSLLESVAAASAVSLTSLRLESPGEAVASAGEAVAPAEAPAGECVSCGLLHPSEAVRCGRCGGRLERSIVPLVIAGKFSVIERVGHGAMGVVYRGEDLHLGRAVAIKTLPRLRPEQAWRLRREARALAAVAHPNLALIYSGESWHGTPILVLEFLAGGTLAARIARGRMPVHEVLDIGIALADVLAAIHRANILHRDIKPSNVGFTEHGALKLLDFGIARLLVSAQPQEPDERESAAAARNVIRAMDDVMRSATTLDGQLLGTPLYMSPEAMLGEPADPSFDSWSVCVVMYEALTGANPFRERSMSLTMRRILLCEAPDLREELPDAPPVLAEFFAKAFSPERQLRMGDGRELLERLRVLRHAIPAEDLR